RRYRDGEQSSVVEEAGCLAVLEVIAGEPAPERRYVTAPGVRPGPDVERVGDGPHLFRWQRVPPDGAVEVAHEHGKARLEQRQHACGREETGDLGPTHGWIDPVERCTGESSREAFARQIDVFETPEVEADVGVPDAPARGVDHAGAGIDRLDAQAACHEHLREQAG